MKRNDFDQIQKDVVQFKNIVHQSAEEIGKCLNLTKYQVDELADDLISLIARAEINGVISFKAYVRLPAENGFSHLELKFSIAENDYWRIDYQQLDKEEYFKRLRQS
jgi:uncharacterized protein YbcV (DUF1398 family)